MRYVTSFYKLFSLIIISFLVSNAYSQQLVKVRDAGIWMGIGLEHRYKKPFTLNLQQELRLNNNSRSIDSYLTEAGLYYKISDLFQIGTNIRYTGNKKKDGIFYQDLRNDYNLSFKIKISKLLKFKYRLQYQKTYANLLRFDQHHYDAAQNKTHFRNKFAFTYKINKIHKAYFSTEIFREYVLLRRAYFNKIRFNIGDKWRLKTGQLNLGLSYERNWTESIPINFFFAKIYYTFKHVQK